MEQVATVTGENFTAASFGPLSTLERFEIRHPLLPKPAKGKVFLKAALGLTGMELSLSKIPPGRAIPFLHRHREHEELYLFLGGKGEMLVDGKVIAVSEGSAVRVAPAGARTLRSTGPEPLTYVCIQAREGSMPDAESITDGEPIFDTPAWPA